MLNKYLVEFLGSMLLVLVTFTTGHYLAVGVTLAIVVYLGGPISGGAYNPAVTFALYNAGTLTKQDVVPYIIVQILGALTGYEIYKRYINKA